MANALLAPVAQVVQFASTPLKVSFWPYALLPALHAARMSIAFRTNAKQAGGGAQLGFLQDMTGFLLMCWSGQIIVNILVNQPPPMLLSAAPWVVYPVVHTVLGLLQDVLPSQSTLDRVMFSVDALTRQAPIIAAVNLAKTSKNLALSESLTAQIVLAALASCGGSAVATMFSVWEPDWRFRAPGVIRKSPTGSLILPSLDLWAGALAGAVYSAATLSHPYWASVLLDLGLRHKLQGAFCTDLEARALVVVVLSTLYAYRATQVVAVKRVAAPQPAAKVANGSAVPKKDL